MELAINEVKLLDNSQFTCKCDNYSMLHLPCKQKCSCRGHISLIEIDSKKSLDHNLPNYFSIGEVYVEVSLNEPMMCNAKSFKNMKNILVYPICINCCENVSIANLSKLTVQLSSEKMLQRLAVTNPKNDRMDPHGVNPTL